MTVNESLSHIISSLELFRTRIGMYVANADDVDDVKAYITGFTNACGTLGFGYDSDITCTVLHENGWEAYANGPVGQMRSSGLTERQIVQEIVNLEIAKWRRLLAEKTQY